MTVEDIPIRNPEQARIYFCTMGCSRFHIARQNFKRRDEYYALNISSETEAKWRQEQIECYFSEFTTIKREKMGLLYSQLNDMIVYDRNYLERMFLLTLNHYNNILPEQIHLVLSVIIGNNGTETYGGIIELSFKLRCTDLAEHFLEITKALIGKAEEHHISLPWLRGYLIDIIVAFKMNVDVAYLKQLREKDNVANFQYHKQGAEEGIIYSMRMLAKCYLNGSGCDINKNQAKHLLEKAAESGNILALQELAELFY